MLKDYLGQPSKIEGLGNIYPVRIFEFERFRDLASKYILISKRTKEIMNDIKIKESQFEILVVNIVQFEMAYKSQELDMQKEAKDFYDELLNIDVTLQYSLDEFCELMKIICREDFAFDEKTLTFKSKSGELNEENFDLFREEVLRQNMMFEPLVYEDFITQGLLEKWRELHALENLKNDVDLESIVQLVSLEFGIDPNSMVNYTYYQVMANYQRFNAKESYEFIKLAGANGMLSGKEKQPNPAKKIDMEIHPEEQGFLGGSGYAGKVDDVLLSE